MKAAEHLKLALRSPGCIIGGECVTVRRDDIAEVLEELRAARCDAVYYRAQRDKLN